MSTPLLENILHQPKALQAVSDYQCGGGRDSLLRAAALLKSGKKIVLTGMGASFYACISLQYLLGKHGLSVSAIEAGELLYFTPSVIDRDTVVLLVSRSGESVEVVKLLPMIRSRGAATIGIVNVPGSTLHTAADTAIVVNSPADQLVAIQSYTGAVAAFALLAAAMAGELEQAAQELGGFSQVLSRWIPDCVSASLEWRDFLTKAAPVYLVGRGPSLGSVVEGVLLMHETAKMAAVGMSVPQFRHGPVEAVDSHFHAIIIGTQAVTRELDRALAHDLIRMGAQVRWIGPSENVAGVSPLSSWPEGVPERFLPIAEVIPLQLAAYRAAELRGFRPGDFRWAPLVTTTESGFSFSDATHTKP